VSVSRQTDPSGRHLREYQLADFLDGALDSDAEKDLRLHLDACAVCQQRLASASEHQQPAESTPEGLGEDRRLPEVFLQALEARQVASPAPGQLWRLRAPGEEGDLAVLAAIVRVEEDHVVVVPVTPDPQEATDLWAVQLPIADTGLVMAFWTSLATPVGFEVLDVWLGWTDATPLTELLRAQRRGEEPPRGLQLGRPLDVELAAYRADLGVELMDLQEARLVPDTPEDAQAEDDLVDALVQQSWTPSRLKAAAGDLTSREAADVLGRRRQLTDAQAQQLTAALGGAYARPVARPEWGWIAAVASPMRRHRYERLAGAAGADPWTYRCDVAAEPASVAARGSTDSAADWDALAEQQLLARERAAGFRV
jgi:hypothetical protein